jgi:hypothetical protein
MPARVGRARPTHSLVQQVLSRLIGAHVDGPRGDVSQQHGTKASVQTANAVFSPYRACGACETLVHYARRARVRTWAEGALCLQAGLDNVERAGHDAGGDTGGGPTQRIDRPVWQLRHLDGEGSKGAAPVAALGGGGHVAGRRSRNCRRIPVGDDSRGRRLGVVIRHWGSCSHRFVRAMLRLRLLWKGSVLAVVPSGVPQCAETPQHSSDTVASGWTAPLTCGAAEGASRQDRARRDGRYTAGRWLAGRSAGARGCWWVLAGTSHCEHACSEDWSGELPAAPAKHVGQSSTLAANSVSRKWMTATLRFDLHHSIAGTPHLDHPHTPVEHRNHVRAVPRPRHYEAPMAAALDQAPLQLVHQRRRLQAARPQVRCTPQDRWRNLGTGYLGHFWDALDGQTGRTEHVGMHRDLS